MRPPTRRCNVPRLALLGMISGQVKAIDLLDKPAP